MVQFEFWRHELELLDLANVAFKHVQAFLGVQIPESDGQIV